MGDTQKKGGAPNLAGARKYVGRCHCGAVRFEVETDLNVPVFDPTTEWLRIIGTTLPLPPGMPDPISNFNATAHGLNLTIEGDGKHWIGTGVFPQG